MENNNHLPVLNIKPEDLPTVITQTVNNLTAIETKIQQSKEKAINAADTAQKAKSKSAGWSFFGTDKKEAIKALQNAVSDQAYALKDSVEASKELFDNQKKMIQSINYLFGLGVSNMAANRTVVRELTLKLQNASEEELSELARKEIEAVIMQLRAQEDMWNRIEAHEIIFREHKNELNKIEERLNDIDDRFNQERDNLLNRFTELESKIKREIDSLAELENELKKENEANFEQSQNLLNKEIARIEKQLVNKTFFDSAFYKLIVGASAIAALVIHFI